MTHDLIYQIALTFIKGVGPVIGKELIAFFGDAKTLFDQADILLKKIARVGDLLANPNVRQQALARAEQELAFISKYNIIALSYRDSLYPYRLKECMDGPLVLYVKGNSDLNMQRMVAVVGTRKTTSYGKEMCEQLVTGLAESQKHLGVVSGLAYGVDICAHKSALAADVCTFAVLGHGLDRIYPAAHSSVAERILQQNGALITEYPSQTKPDAPHFVQRNRIIAGLCDCTVVVESAAQGGALLTAMAANSYDRDVFAFPGRANDSYSAGCNRLIHSNQAALITSGVDLERLMNWNSNKAQGVMQPLFIELTAEEQLVVQALRSDPLHLDTICRIVQLPVQKTMSLLIQMEFKGLIKILPGHLYKLI